MKLSKHVIDLFEPFVDRTWDQMLTQANLSSIVTINKGPLYEKAIKRMRDLYPQEILQACGILDVVDKAKKEAP